MFWLYRIKVVSEVVARVVLEIVVLDNPAVEKIIHTQSGICSFSPTKVRLSSQEVLSGCCTCEAAAVPSESSSCSLVVPFEDLGTVLPFHLGDNHHQHSAAFVNRVRCLFEFTFNLQNNFYRYQVRSLTQSVSLLKSFLFDFVNIVL